MKYMGSKSRIVDNILPIIQERLRDYNIKTYIEPFCGGCNVIDKVQCDTKIASDNQKYLIALLKNVQEITEFPDELTREHYSEVRECFNKGLNTYPDWYIGAIGFLGSYNGRFYDGGFAKTNYSKSKTTDHIIIRNYYKEAKENLIEQIPRLEDIQSNVEIMKSYILIKLTAYFIAIFHIRVRNNMDQVRTLIMTDFGIGLRR